MYVLRQEAVAIPYPKRVDKHVAGLILPSNLPQSIPQPEAANQKGRFRAAEIVGSDIPHNVETTSKFMTNGLDGRHKSGVIGCDQAKFGEQKGTGVEIIAVESSRKCLAFRIPCAFDHLLTDTPGDRAPIGRALRKVKEVRNGFEPLATGPAHRCRMCVHTLAAPVFPDTGVR